MFDLSNNKTRNPPPGQCAAPHNGRETSLLENRLLDIKILGRSAAQRDGRTRTDVGPRDKVHHIFRPLATVAWGGRALGETIHICIIGHGGLRKRGKSLHFGTKCCCRLIHHSVTETLGGVLPLVKPPGSKESRTRKLSLGGTYLVSLIPCRACMPQRGQVKGNREKFVCYKRLPCAGRRLKGDK